MISAIYNYNFKCYFYADVVEQCVRGVMHGQCGEGLLQ